MRYSFLLLSLCLIPKILLATVADDKSASVRYELEANFDYLSEGISGFNTKSIENPGSRAATLTLSEARPRSGGTRTLGLTMLKLTTQVRAHERAAFSFVLRPDVLNREPDPLTGERRVIREFDGRAGDTYRPATRMQLLDSYQLDIISGPTAMVSLGVFEGLVEDNFAYRSPLAFGLQTKLPEKFFAIRLRWGEADLRLPKAKKPHQSSILYELWAYQSHQDRAEVYATGRRTFDQAPVAQDPYLGAATGLKWSPELYLSLNATLGFGATARDESRVEELWGQFAAKHRWQAMGVPLHSTFEYRLWQENWTKTQQERPKLVHQSLMIGSRWQVTSESAALLGLHLGESEIHDIEESNTKFRRHGWQADIGLMHQIGKTVDASLIYSYETRSLSGHENRGGFSAARPDKDHINRLAISVNYHVGSTL